jgi:tRNA(Ile)-lysidine synthase
MHKFVLNLLTEWRKLGLPFENETIIVAVSGGADSMSLAIALDDLKKRKKLDMRFVIAHLNHGLRGHESDEDERFVKEFAEKYGIELVLKKAHVSKKEGNLEQNARDARYAFLLETAENLHANFVLTAHTLNDQAETFLMNLIRGSGLGGLGGIRSVRKILENGSGIQLVRPLLTSVTRQMTEEYCHDCDFDYRYDSMNEDLSFQRVRIRKVLIPLLKDFNPKIVESLAKTSFLLQADFDALEKISEISLDLESLLSKNGEKFDLETKELDNLFPSIRRKLIRDWLKSQRGSLRTLDSKHLEAIEKLIFSRKSGKIIELPNGEFVSKENGKLSFYQKKS